MLDVLAFVPDRMFLRYDAELSPAVDERTRELKSPNTRRIDVGSSPSVVSFNLFSLEDILVLWHLY